MNDVLRFINRSINIQSVAYFEVDSIYFEDCGNIHCDGADFTIKERRLDAGEGLEGVFLSVLSEDCCGLQIYHGVAIWWLSVPLENLEIIQRRGDIPNPALTYGFAQC